jgi:transposase
MQNKHFTEKDCQAVMKYLFLKGNSAKIIDAMLIALGDKCPSYSTFKNWVARIRTGLLSTEDEERSGRPTQVTIPENMDTIHS